MDSDIARAIEALEQAVPATARRSTVVRTIIEDMAHRARSSALLDLRIAPDVADELGVTRTYITRVAKRENIGTHIGRDRLYLPEDVDALRAAMLIDRRRRIVG